MITTYKKREREKISSMFIYLINYKNSVYVAPTQNELYMQVLKITKSDDIATDVRYWSDDAEVSSVYRSKTNKNKEISVEIQYVDRIGAKRDKSYIG